MVIILETSLVSYIGNLPWWAQSVVVVMGLFFTGSGYKIATLLVDVWKMKKAGDKEMRTELMARVTTLEATLQSQSMVLIKLSEENGSMKKEIEYLKLHIAMLEKKNRGLERRLRKENPDLEIVSEE